MKKSLPLVTMTLALGTVIASSTIATIVGGSPWIAPTTRDLQTRLTGGYGFVNWVNGAGSQPRSGQVVARVTF